MPDHLIHCIAFNCEWLSMLVQCNKVFTRNHLFGWINDALISEEMFLTFFPRVWICHLWQLLQDHESSSTSIVFFFYFYQFFYQKSIETKTKEKKKWEYQKRERIVKNNKKEKESSYACLDLRIKEMALQRNRLRLNRWVIQLERPLPIDESTLKHPIRSSAENEVPLILVRWFNLVWKLCGTSYLWKRIN